MKKTLLSISLLSLTIITTAQSWFQGFEDVADFTLDDVPGWDFIDVEKGQTWGISNGEFSVEYPNSGYTGTAIVFNHLTTQPALDAEWAANTGDKSLIFFASGANSSTTPNDDWAILPAIDVINGDEFSFWAKSITDTWGLEKIQVAITSEVASPTPSDFTIISEGANLEVPKAWKEYSYDLSAYAGQTIRLAIHYISNDTFAMLTDDYQISNSLAVSEVALSKSKLFVASTSNGEYKVQLPDNFNAATTQYHIYSITGSKVKSTKVKSLLDLQSLNAGVYIIKATDGQSSATTKFIKK